MDLIQNMLASYTNLFSEEETWMCLALCWNLNFDDILHQEGHDKDIKMIGASEL